MVCSEVFRAMIGIGSNFKDRQPPVQLSDPEIESSKILENVLDIQCQLKDICDIDLFESVLVIKFLLKYEFKRELELVRLQLRSRLLDDTDAVWVFLRACHSGHFDVCAKAVRIAPLQRWQGDHVTDGKFGGAAEDVWTLDPTGMPQKYFDLMPADCRWALFRSCREAMTAQNPSSAQRSRMARAFTRLMSLRGERSSEHS